MGISGVRGIVSRLFFVVMSDSLLVKVKHVQLMVNAIWKLLP